MIDGINDSDDNIHEFMNKIGFIKEKVTIRISKLNETKASNRNCLKIPSEDKLNHIKEVLESEDFNCYVFFSLKNDNLNCGQLITEIE